MSVTIINDYLKLSASSNSVSSEKLPSQRPNNFFSITKHIFCIFALAIVPPLFIYDHHLISGLLLMLATGIHALNTPLKHFLNVSLLALLWIVAFTIVYQESATTSANHVITFVSISVISLISYLFRSLRELKNDQQQQAYLHDSLGELCNALLRSNRDCIKLLNPQGVLLQINNMGLSLLEANDKTQVLDKNWLEFFSGKDHSLAKQAWQQALDKGFGEFVGFCPTLNGHERYWHNSIAPVYNRCGSISHVLVASRNITESVQNNLRITESNDELNSLLDSLGGPFLSINQASKITYSNLEAKRQFESTSRKLEGQNIEQTLPDFMSKHIATWLQNASEKEYTSRHRAHDEETGSWYELEITPKRNGVNLLILDITNQTKEELIRHQEHTQCELFQELEGYGGWEYSIDDKHLAFAPQALSILGISENKNLDHSKLMRELMTPTDRLKLTRALLSVSLDNIKASLSSNIETMKGDKISIRLSLRSIRDRMGRSIKVIGTIQDITIQKARESYLKEAESFVRGIIDALPSQVCVIDKNGLILKVNRAWLTHANKADADPLSLSHGQNYLTVCEQSAENNCEDASAVLKGIRQVIAGQLTQFDYQYSMGTPSGICWYNMKVNPITNDSALHKTNSYVIAHEDITERQTLILDNETKQDRLRLAYEGTNDGLWD